MVLKAILLKAIIIIIVKITVLAIIKERCAHLGEGEALHRAEEHSGEAEWS
jgi:hypothetical protein